MKGAFAIVSTILFAASLPGHAAEQLVPAGSLIQCTVSEPKLSSKTTDIGDPVLCQVSHVELYGRSVLPYGSYLVGRFEEYKDPGHFVGKGWMELKFERLVVPPGQIVPVATKVVYAPKYPVDKQGRIHGNGHPVRDIVEWSIPLLWPIDLLNLPRRGPRPVLKAETRLTLKVMDDIGVPSQQFASAPLYPQPAPPEPYGFQQRAPMPYYAPPVAAPPPPPQPMNYNYAPPPVPPTPMVPVWRASVPPAAVVITRDGRGRLARRYWFANDHEFAYIALNGAPVIIPARMLDMPATVEANRRRGILFPGI